MTNEETRPPQQGPGTKPSPHQGTPTVGQLIDILGERHAAGEPEPQLRKVCQEHGVNIRVAQDAIRFVWAKARTETAAEPAEPSEPEFTDTWEPIDLGPYLRGEIERPEPSIGLSRSDGLRMLYPAKEHSIIGEMESGKSWFSLACAKAELDAGNTVLYMHFEEADPSDTVERLLALGTTPHRIERQFRFVAPQRPVNDSLGRLLEPAPTLVIFDGVEEALSLHRFGSNDTDGIAQFRRHLVMPCLQAGAATLACDHVVKDKDRRNRNAIGSVHKGNGLSGSLIVLETAEPFGRGKRGRAHVFVTKDRPGHLRRHGRADKTPGKTFMGELVVDAENETLDLKFWAAREEGEPTGAEDADRTRVLSAVIALSDAGIEVKLANIQARARMKRAAVSQELAGLVIDGVLVETKGPRNTSFYAPAAREGGAE